LDGESPYDGLVEGAAAGAAAFWAVTVNGRAATQANARTRKADFNACEYIRFSSAVKQSQLQEAVI
jgi:hypothetical protein